MRFPAAALGCCPRAGVEARAGLEACAGAGPRAGMCPPPTAAGGPPPRGAPPRPFSCAKATTQIRTDSPIIFFTLTSWRYLAREISLHVLFHQAELPDLRPAKAGVAGQGADPAAGPSHASSTLAR